ncbi:MAG: DUF4136 domain-containing protein [Gammaproteobacteria bacterium]|nr:DUF4136 domain-containing protein [Gammaproteobacteria bacterium]
MVLRWVLFVAGAGFLFGCASSARVQTDFNPSADFSTYRSFSFISDKPLLVASIGLSPLLEGRLINATRGELTSKGYRFVANREMADFVVSFTMGARDKIRVTSYPSNYRGYNQWGWGTSYYNEVNVRNYTEGTLSIDVFDVKRRNPVWHGWAVKTISTQDRRNPTPVINEVVAAIFADFPAR